MTKDTEVYLWKDRKRPFFGLPLSFTTYKVNEEKFIICSGIINLLEEEIRLYRILDITLTRNLYERVFGLGTIKCCSADQTTPEFSITNIRNAKKVKELLSDLVEKSRNNKNIHSNEFMVNNPSYDQH